MSCRWGRCNRCMERRKLQEKTVCVCLWVNVCAYVCITLVLRLTCWSIIISDLKDDLWSRRGVTLLDPRLRRSTLCGCVWQMFKSRYFQPWKDNETTFLFCFFKLLYSAACLAPGISPSWVQRSIFNKHIMKKQACNAAAEWSHHPTYGSAVFHLFVHRRFVCCSSLTATFLPEAFIKDWHGRNGLSGTGSLEPLGSMDALRARFHSERDAATVEGAEADYHSTNKNKAWCETRAKTKGCIRVFPQDEALPTATVCHRAHTDAHTCVHAGW